MSPNEPDARTLARLRSGDIGALATIYELLGPRVYRLSRRIISNQADAEDATQEVFIRAFEQAAKFDGRSRFSTWLYRLAVHHCLNKAKQRDRKRASEHRAAELLEHACDQSTVSPLERVVGKEQSELLDNLLKSLPTNYRACLVLREFEDLSYAEVAEILQIPVGTVMSRLSRAREQLCRNLKKIEQETAGLRNKGNPSAVQPKEDRDHEMHGAS